MTNWSVGSIAWHLAASFSGSAKIIRVKKGYRTFLMMKLEGRDHIVSTLPSEFDIRDPDVNAATRQAFCRLTGTPGSVLAAACKKMRDEEFQVYVQERFDTLISKAADTLLLAEHVDWKSQQNRDRLRALQAGVNSLAAKARL